MSGVRITEVAGPDGVIECAEVGVPVARRPSLVLIHGIQGTKRVWDPLISVLVRDHHVVAPNLRGRGGSCVPKTPESYGMAEFADDLASVLNGMAGEVVLVGWSMGGLVTLDYLYRYGADQIAGIALVSTSACLHAPGLPEAVWFRGEAPQELIADAKARAVRLNLSDTADDMAVAGAWLSAAKADYRAMLGSIEEPVLVLHGADDAECPPDHGRALAAGIVGARLELWEGVGHVPMAQCSTVLAETLGAFVASCETMGSP